MENETNVGAEETLNDSEIAGEIDAGEGTVEIKAKPKLSLEEQLAIHKRETKKIEKKLGLADEKPKYESKENQKSDEFNEGQLAYLSTKGLETDEDLDFTKAELKKSGGTLRELMSNEYFQSKIKLRADAKAALDATPTTKRSRGGTDDSTEFHYAKYISSGKLPEDREMADKVIEMRRKKETSDSEFL